MTSNITSAPAAIARKRPSAASIMLTFLALAYMLSMFDRLLMVVLAEMVKAEFQLSDKQLSMLTGAAFVVVYSLTAIVAGWGIDRFSRKKVLVWAVAVWSLMTMACGLAQSFVQMAIARAGVGVGEGGIVPVGTSVINDLYEPHKRPLAVAIFYTGGTLGTLSCFLLGSWLAVNYGWRVAFFVAGPIGIALALVLAWFSREPARRQPPRTALEEGAKVNSFVLIYRNKPLMWLLLAGAVCTFGNLGMMQWLPIFFMRSHDMSMAKIGLFFGPVIASGMAIGMMLGGWLGNRIAHKSPVQLVTFSGWSMGVLIPLYLFAFWIESMPLALFGAFLATAFSVLYSPCFTSSWQFVCDPRACGTTAGISGLTCNLIGGAICTFAVGVVSDLLAPAFGRDSLRYALMASMVFLVLGGGLFLYSARLIRRSEAG